MIRVFVLLLIASLWLPGPVSAQSESAGWINDVLYVPLRSGAGSQYRIVHRGLKSGTRVNILEWPEDNDWARVTYEGEEGWIEKQYLSRTPTAQIRLESLEQRFRRTSEEVKQLKTQLSEVRQERDQLASEKQQLEQALAENRERVEHLEEVAEDPIRLDKANRELNEKVSMLRTELDQAEAENSMLRSDKTSRKWAMGAGILLLGGLLGWIFKSRGGRGRSSWVN